MKKLWLKFCDWWLGEDPYQDWKKLYAELQELCLTIQSENRELRDSLDALRNVETAQAKHPKCQCGKVAKVEPRKANRVSSKGRNANKKRL
jgi:hypothetical protein